MPYMVEHEGIVLGPFTSEQLSQCLAANTIAPNDLGCDQESGRWVPVSKLVPIQPGVPAAALANQGGVVSNIKPATLFKLVLAFLGSALFAWRLMVLLHRVLQHMPHGQ